MESGKKMCIHPTQMGTEWMSGETDEMKKKIYVEESAM